MKRFFTILLLLTALAASAQVTKKYRYVDGEWVEVVTDDQQPRDPQQVSKIAADTIPAIPKLEADTTIDVSALSLPPTIFMPVIFDSYDMTIADRDTLAPRLAEGADAWVVNALRRNRLVQTMRQRYMIANPAAVRYNINTLPEAPKKYHAFVDPSTERINVEEIVIAANEAESDIRPVELRKIYWLKSFKGLVQFSQAYNSPNWYQGGNNNLNMIVNAVYNVKLNPAFNPNFLFDTTVQYKLAMNSAPDDELRDYSISEDLFQINSKFGVKATRRWYYSATVQFKTQLLNNYKTNTYDLTAAFLSPADLNVGLGMTYSYASKNKRFSLDASIAPISYNMKMCINKKMDPAVFGIKEGHKTVSQYGSNIDCKMTWNIAWNISLLSRLTGFTDYSYLQADWENTLSFSINKFLSTQLYLHLRYDTTTPPSDDPHWHKLQLKEILSFGFSYTFATV